MENNHEPGILARGKKYTLHCYKPHNKYIWNLSSTFTTMDSRIGLLRKIFLLSLVCGIKAVCSNTLGGCECKGNEVSCSNLTSLKIVPPNIPSTTTTLLLRNNSLATLNDNVFSNLSSLLALDLNSNKISRISNNAFKGLTSLINITLSNNSIASLQDFLIEDLGNLKRLDLAMNKITTISQNVLNYFDKLEELDLSQNLISRIHHHAFTSQHDLEVLKLQGNSLTTATKKWFSQLDNLISLTMYNNVWNCSCNMKDYYQWLKTDPRHTARSIESALNINCRLPQEHANERIESLLMKDFQCQNLEPTQASTTTSTPQSIKPKKTKSTTRSPHTNSVVTVSTIVLTTTTRTVPNMKHSTTEEPLPPIRIQSSISVLVSNGKDANLTCHAAGRGTVAWSKNQATKISSNTSHYILIHHKLIIKSTSKDDNGRFCCLADYVPGGQEKEKQCFTLEVKATDKTSAAVYVAIVLLIISFVVALAVYGYRRVQRRRRERYGLLSDSAVFQPAHDDIRSGNTFQSQTISEEYV